MSVPSDSSLHSLAARNLSVSHAATVTSATSAALAVGANGATNAALLVHTATTASATGVQITSDAAGAGASLAAISSAANEALNIDGKGGGAVNLGTRSTGGVRAVGMSIQGLLHDSVSLTSATQLTVAESGSLLTLGGAGGYTVTLPALTSGLSMRFAVRAAIINAAVTIATADGDTVMYGVINEATDGTTSATAANIITVTTAAPVGSSITLDCDGTLWYVVVNCGANNAITVSAV